MLQMGQPSNQQVTQKEFLKISIEAKKMNREEASIETVCGGWHSVLGVIHHSSG